VPGSRGSERPAGLLLFPGAGAGREQAALVAIDAAVSSLPIAVERADFPYRLAGRRAPDRAEVLVAHVVSSATAFAASLGVAPGRVALGGRSMGGRICSMAVAEGLPAAALVLVSYPLHPPGRPERPRTAHLDRLELPCLLCSGTKDPFGSVEELELAAGLVPGPVELVFLEGADHSLRRRDAEVAGVVARWLDGLGPRRPGVRRPRA
jgi:predicted alpha/beta-hydrolase family hydrolase